LSGFSASLSPDPLMLDRLVGRQLENFRLTKLTADQSVD